MPRTVAEYGDRGDRAQPSRLAWRIARTRRYGKRRKIRPGWRKRSRRDRDRRGAARKGTRSTFRRMNLSATGDPRRAPPPSSFGRYHPDRIGATFRRDPAATMLDIGGLAAGGAGAGARAASMGGRFARNIADIDPPAPRPAPPPRQQAPSRREFIEGAPSTEALGKQADVFFEAARKSGVRFSAQTFAPFRKKLVRTLREEGADKVLHPKIARLVGLIEDAPVGVAPDMGNLMILRRQFGAAASDMDKSTSRLGAIGVDLVDDFVESGSASTSGVMRDANRLWARMRKSETIERAIAKAETAQQGLEAGLRAEFKSIYRGHRRQATRNIAASRKTRRPRSRRSPKAISPQTPCGASPACRAAPGRNARCKTLSKALRLVAGSASRWVGRRAQHSAQRPGRLPDMRPAGWQHGRGSSGRIWLARSRPGARPGSKPARDQRT